MKQKRNIKTLTIKQLISVEGFTSQKDRHFVVHAVLKFTLWYYKFNLPYQ